MYAIGIAMLIVGILTCAVGIALIVKASPSQTDMVTEHVNAALAEPVEDQPDFNPPGTLVMGENNMPYMSEVINVPAFMFTLWKANIIEAGAKVTHEQDMGNGLVTAAVLIPQEPGACGHEQCQPGYEGPTDEGDDVPPSGGLYL